MTNNNNRLSNHLESRFLKRAEVTELHQIPSLVGLIIMNPFTFISSLLSSARVAISKGNNIPTNTNSLKQQCAGTINEFLHRISYQYPATVHFDDTLKKKVENSMLKAGLSTETLGRIQPYINSSVNIAITCYAHTSPQVQESVALFTSYAISIDDMGQEFVDEMKSFVSDLLDGQPAKNLILRGFFDIITAYDHQFGQFGGNMIVKSAIDFVCGCYLELERESRESKATERDTAKAPEFAEYLRVKTGVAEAYAFFLFPEEVFPEDELLHAYLPAIPYIVQYFNYVNDLFSFYKEADENANYVSNHAAAHKISPFESLDILCKRIGDIFHTINDILAPNENLRYNIQQFMYGYAVYHMCSSRYKLQELDIPAVFEAKRLLFPDINQEH